MIVDGFQQRDIALTEKIQRVILNAKTFAKILYVAHNKHIVVEVECREDVYEACSWLTETTKMIYTRYNDDPKRIETLYTVIAQRWPYSNVVISELTSDGSGTTTHFTSTYPSQIKKI